MTEMDTHDMRVSLGKDRQCMAQHVTATHATMTELTRKTKRCRHEPYMDNFFSSPELYDDFANKQIYSCWTVRPNRSCMPQDLALKTIKLKRGDIHIRTRADLMAILWWEKRDICMLMNIHDVPAEGNCCSEGGKAISCKL